MTRKELIISGEGNKLNFRIKIGNETIARFTGENFKNLGSFYFIKTGHTHTSIEKN